MASEGEGRAYPTWVDWRSLVWEKANHHGRKNLRAATDTDGEYHSLSSDRWGGDSCTWWDFFNGAVVETRRVVYGKVPHQHSFPLEAVLRTMDGRGTENAGASQPLSKDSHRSSQCRWEGWGEDQALVLLASLLLSYESLVTALLVGMSTIKMDEVTTMILQNEILKWKNQASSWDGGSSALAIYEGASGSRQSDRGSRGGRSRSKTRDPSKIRCYRCVSWGIILKIVLNSEIEWELLRMMS